MQPDSAILNLDYEEKATIVIPAWQSWIYLSWFLEPEFAGEVRRLHKLVGNANTDNRHIFVGTGSSHLYMASLYALAPIDTSKQPITVVSAASFYSSYPLMTDFLKSGLYKWGGDAYTFNGEEPCINGEVMLILPQTTLMISPENRSLTELVVCWFMISHTIGHSILR
ncbi:hypothetical protein C5167_019733 [Papaver somniferum]|uniref:Alliinase C-terminal domain-containing protein n=1 Tax=Papaver somniferum TaxID=3469 RepID=A0A4Y7IR13_PAPSO|nr:hypothetical protein C5167_019733 [Papaver somniferum]